MPSSAVLDSSGGTFDIFKVHTHDLEFWLGHRVRYFSFVEGEERKLTLQMLKKKALQLKLPAKEGKARLFHRVKTHLSSRSNLSRLNVAAVTYHLQPGEFVFFTINYKRSFCKISLTVKGMRREGVKYYVMKFPETKDEDFLVEQLRNKTRNWQ